MKRLILFTGLVIFLSQSIAQSITVDDSGKLMARKVFEFAGKSAEEIYDAAIMWANRSFSNPKEAISSQIRPKYIKANGYSSKAVVFGGLSFLDLSFDIEIEIKNGKSRMTINNFYILSPDYKDRAAEVYAVKNKVNELRTNSQAKQVIKGSQKIADNLFNSFGALFTSSSDDW